MCFRGIAPFALCLMLVASAVSAAQRVVFFPDWFPGAQFAGMYVALDHGYFPAAGLDVTLHPFAFGRDVSALMDAQSDVAAIGSSEGYVFVQGRAAGADLCAFTAVLRESPAGLITLAASGITAARDLADRRLGVHKFAGPIVHWCLARAGVPAARVQLVAVGDDLELLAGGEVDALQGYAIEEFVRARQRWGAQAGFLSFHDMGFPSYAQVIYSTRHQSGRHAAAIAAFVAVLRRGWAHALADPDDALAAVMNRLDSSGDRELQRAMLTAVWPYVAPGGETPLGAFDLEKWRRLQSACVEMGLVADVEDPAAFCLELTDAPP